MMTAAMIASTSRAAPPNMINMNNEIPNPCAISQSHFLYVYWCFFLVVMHQSFDLKAAMITAATTATPSSTTPPITINPKKDMDMFHLSLCLIASRSFEKYGLQILHTIHHAVKFAVEFLDAADFVILVYFF